MDTLRTIPTELSEKKPRATKKRRPRKSGQWGTVLQLHGRSGYVVRFRHDGVTYQRSAGSAWPTADAKRRRAQVLLEAGTPLADVLSSVFGDVNGATMTFREATEHYLAYAATRKTASTLRNDASRLRVLGRAAWAGKRLGAIRCEDFLPWLAERQESRDVERRRPRRPGETLAEYRKAKDRTWVEAVPGASGATLNRDLNLASALFRWARRAKFVDENPVREVERFSERGRERETYLTAAESQGLIAECSPVLRPLVLTALHTGMRRGELLALRWRNVDLSRRQIVVAPETEKAGRGRVVPMTAALHEELTALKRRRPLPALDGSDPVLCLADGSCIVPWVLRDLWEPTVARCEAIAPEKRARVTFHSLRHTAASLMVAAGVPLFDVAKILGHSTLAVTMRYAHHAPEAGRSAIDRLGSVLAQRGSTRTKKKRATS